MPSGTSLLTESDIFANQVFKYGDNAHALQFHPEVMEPTIQKWTHDSVKRLQMPQVHFDGFRKSDRAVDKWTRRLSARIFLDRIDAIAAEAAD